jgi:hypothetical protein
MRHGAGGVLVIGVLLAACGARTGLELSEEDAGPGPGPRPEPGACVLDPPGTLAVVDEEAPGFVTSLAALETLADRFVLGATVGWSHELGGRIVVLDGALRPLATVAAGRERVYAAPGAAGVLLAVLEEDNEVWLAEHELSAAGVPEAMARAERLLCPRECAAARQAPLAGPPGHSATVLLERFVDDVAGVVVAPLDPAAPLVEGEAIPDVAASCVVRWTGTDLLLVVATRTLTVEGYRLDAAGRLVEHLPWTLEARYHGPFVAAVARYDGAVYIAYGGAGGLELAQVDYSGALVATAVVDADAGAPNGLALSQSGATVAVSWGETFGAGRVGAHLVVVGASDLAPWWGPGLLGPEPDRSSASTTIWTAVAPASFGHVVAWNDWQPDANYAIYGKRVVCGG